MGTGVFITVSVEPDTGEYGSDLVGWGGQWDDTVDATSDVDTGGVRYM